jgi:hypothetical protein
MMDNSTSQVTEHYPASLDKDKTWEINEGLLKKKLDNDHRILQFQSFSEFGFLYEHLLQNIIS